MEKNEIIAYIKEKRILVAAKRDEIREMKDNVSSLLDYVNGVDDAWEHLALAVSSLEDAEDALSRTQ